MKYYTISDAVLKTIEESLTLTREVARGSSIEVSLDDIPAFIASNPLSECVARPWYYFSFQYLNKRCSIIRRSDKTYHILCENFDPEIISSVDSKHMIESVRNSYGIYSNLGDAMDDFCRVVSYFCAPVRRNESTKYKQLEFDIF